LSRIDSFFTENGEPIIESDEFYHLSKVLRKKEGDKVRLLDGKGNIFFGEISKIEKRRAFVRVLEKKSYKKRAPSINFFIAFVPQEKRGLITQKLTELGVSSINFFPSKYSKIGALKEGKEKKLLKIAIGAIKQSGNPFIPEITFLNSFEEILKIADIKILLSQDGEFLIKSIMKKEQNFSINIVLGPEGGFSKGEIEAMKKNNFIKMKLSENILRTETAAISAAAIMGYITEAQCF